MPNQLCNSNEITRDISKKKPAKHRILSIEINNPNDPALQYRVNVINNNLGLDKYYDQTQLQSKAYEQAFIIFYQ